MLADLLARAMPVAESAPQGGQALVFRGEPHRILFVANTPGRTHVGGLYVFKIGEEATGSDTVSKELLVRQVLYRPRAVIGWDKESGEQQRAVLKNIAGTSLRYFGELDGSGSARWHDSWKSALELPSLVEVRLQFEHGDPRSWPILVVQPKLK